MSTKVLEALMNEAVLWLRARYEGPSYSAAEVAEGIGTTSGRAFAALEEGWYRNLVTRQNPPVDPVQWRAASRS